MHSLCHIVTSELLDLVVKELEEEDSQTPDATDSNTAVDNESGVHSNSIICDHLNFRSSCQVMFAAPCVRFSTGSPSLYFARMHSRVQTVFWNNSSAAVSDMDETGGKVMEGKENERSRAVRGVDAELHSPLLDQGLESDMRFDAQTCYQLEHARLRALQQEATEREQHVNCALCPRYRLIVRAR